MSRTSAQIYAIKDIKNIIDDYAAQLVHVPRMRPVLRDIELLGFIGNNEPLPVITKIQNMYVPDNQREPTRVNSFLPAIREFMMFLTGEDDFNFDAFLGPDHIRDMFYVWCHNNRGSFGADWWLY